MTFPLERKSEDMDRRDFLKSTGLAALGAANTGWAETTPRRRPNVLFILPDEWRGQALGCMGNPDVQTPHLDKLASEGVLFRNTLSNTPVCCPARANILTGTFASHNGMVANDLRLKEAEVTLGDLFAQAGYRTGYVGKWHLDGGPRLPGYIPPGRRRHGFEDWAANECNHNYFYNWYFRRENVPIVAEKYMPEVWTDLAIQFLYQSQAKPFFLMLSYGSPHEPYRAPLDYVKRYNPKTLTMRPNYLPGLRGASREDIATYYASMTAVDDQVDRLLRALRELGLEDDTLVFFSSDHGNMLGSQGRIWKRFPWEESIRVPGILRLPGAIPAGRKTDALLSSVDFGPTLLSLCGLPVPADMQGTDLSRVALGKTAKGPESAYFQIFGPYHGINDTSRVPDAWRAVRTERYMYARFKSGPWLLYDLEKDPYEMRNLVQVESARPVSEKLDKEIANWMEKTGDSWSVDWTAPVEDGGRLYTYRTFSTVDQYLKWAAAHPNLSPSWGR